MALSKREGVDLMNLMCGELLGSGQYRHVYRAKFDEKVVIKYESQNKNRSNVFEYEFWIAYKDTELAKWLAPCYQLSPDATWLVQAFTENLQAHQIPEQVPAIFGDLKPENWGWFEGRAVCRDYGNNLLYEKAFRPGLRLKKAEWRKDAVQYQQRWDK